MLKNKQNSVTPNIVLKKTHKMLRKSVFALVLLQSLALAERFYVQISEDLTTENCTQTLIKLEVKLFANLKHGFTFNKYYQIYNYILFNKTYFWMDYIIYFVLYFIIIFLFSIHVQ